MLKKLLSALLLLIAAIPCVTAQMQRGEKALGVKAGYISHNSSAVAGITFQYALSSHVRIAPEIGGAFRHDNEDALLIDLNVHTPFDVSEGRAALYPLAGVTFNSWGKHNVPTVDGGKATVHTSRFGANIGAGFDLRCSSTIKFNIEAKYSFIKSYSGVFITAGLSYVF